MNIRLTHVDGVLPNLAIMKLSHYHKSQKDNVYFARGIRRELFEPEPYDKVYASCIFKFSNHQLTFLQETFPQVIVGGTGSDSRITVEEVIGKEYEYYDYSIYPDYKWSIGFTSRGCRMHCKFCVVPDKEGKPRSVNSIYDIWRPETERKVVLLDNDFFGQPEEQWKERIKELVDGKFKVSFNQGINIRLVTDEIAHYLSQVAYYDDQFKSRRLYTAWDNLKDEEVFFRGVDRLEKAGVSSKHLMVYMLIGFDPEENWERIFHRFNKMVEKGIKPYPMVYNNSGQGTASFPEMGSSKIL